MQWIVIKKQQQKGWKVLSENLSIKKYQLRFGMFNEKVNLLFKNYDCTRPILESFFHLCNTLVAKQGFIRLKPLQTPAKHRTLGLFFKHLTPHEKLYISDI